MPDTAGYLWCGCCCCSCKGDCLGLASTLPPTLLLLLLRLLLLMPWCTLRLPISALTGGVCAAASSFRSAVPAAVVAAFAVGGCDLLR